MAKIAIIGIRGFPDNFPGSSGIDTYIRQIIPFLKKYNITIYSRSWVKNKFKNKKNIAIPCLHRKYLDTGIYTILATPIALIHHSDILWYQAPGSCLSIGLAKLFKKTTIVTLHGIDWQRQKWSNPFDRFFLRKLESFAVKNADYCTAVSPEVCQYIKSIYHKKCILTPPSLIIQKKIPSKIIKSKFKLSSDSFLLYLGRFVPEKRVDWLIKAYLSSPSINQKYKLVIAGDLEKNNYCQQLLNLAINNSNIIFTNYVSGQIKQELLSNCHLFILPSDLEGNSLSINEALGLNKNCLISDLKINKSYQQKFENIITFKTHSFSDFKKKLIFSTNNLKTNSKKIKNNWNKTANSFIKIFDQQ